MAKESLDFSANVSTEEAATYLEALASSLREGRTLLESGDKSLSLELGKAIRIELEAVTDEAKSRSSIEISLDWRAEPPAEPVPSLTIIPGGQVPAAAGEEG